MEALNYIISLFHPPSFLVTNSFQVQHGISSELDEVATSVRANSVALKGVISVPEHGHSGDLMNLNQQFRNELDLYASVVKVRVQN